MKGLQILLQSLGIKIDPAQIEVAFQQGKDALPRIALVYDEMNVRMQRIEEKLELLLSRTGGEVQPDPVHEELIGTVDSSVLRDAFVNGTPELVVRNGR